MKRSVVILIALVAALALLQSACSRGKDQNAPVTTQQDRDSAKNMPVIVEEKQKGAVDELKETGGVNKKTGETEKDKESLSFVFLSATNLSFERYLEYVVALNYKTTNFEQSRLELLNIIGRFGFIRTSSAAASLTAPYQTTEFAVKAQFLYDALKDLDKVGRLSSESITAVDHTEEMALAQRKMKREQLRMERKNIAIERVSPVNSNWAEREESLEASEDGMDNAEHQEWQVKDKVKWAKITLTLEGPRAPDGVQVPDFRVAFITIANYMLVLCYVLVAALPLLILAALVIWQRKNIAKMFKKKDAGSAGGKPQQ